MNHAHEKQGVVYKYAACPFYVSFEGKATFREETGYPSHG